MDALKPKPNLPTYTQALVYIGGTVIVATVIIGGFIYFKSLANSNTTVTPPPAISTPNDTSTPSALPEQTPVNYDGTYVGSAPVAQGISNATVTVSGNKISGQGTYVGANNAKIGLTVSGDVDTNGNVKGEFSGLGSVEGVAISGGGTYTGKITGNSASISYIASGAGETHKGSIVLTKK